jgi:hypothetical protein
MVGVNAMQKTRQENFYANLRKLPQMSHDDKIPIDRPAAIPKPIDRIGNLAGQGVEEMYGQAAGAIESTAQTIDDELLRIDAEIEQIILKIRDDLDRLHKWVQTDVKPKFTDHARMLRDNGAKMAELIRRGAAVADHAAKSHAAINAQIANGDIHEEKPQDPVDGPVDLDLLARNINPSAGS